MPVNDPQVGEIWIDRDGLSEVTISAITGDSVTYDGTVHGKSQFLLYFSFVSDGSGGGSASSSASSSEPPSFKCKGPGVPVTKGEYRIRRGIYNLPQHHYWVDAQKAERLQKYKDRVYTVSSYDKQCIFIGAFLIHCQEYKEGMPILWSDFERIDDAGNKLPPNLPDDFMNKWAALYKKYHRTSVILFDTGYRYSRASYLIEAVKAGNIDDVEFLLHTWNVENRQPMRTLDTDIAYSGRDVRTSDCATSLDVMWYSREANIGYIAIMSDNYEMVSTLLEGGADIRRPRVPKKFSILMEAIDAKKWESVGAILAHHCIQGEWDNGGLIDYADEDGLTAAMLAIRNDNMPMGKLAWLLSELPMESLYKTLQYTVTIGNFKLINYILADDKTAWRVLMSVYGVHYRESARIMCVRLLESTVDEASRHSLKAIMRNIEILNQNSNRTDRVNRLDASREAALARDRARSNARKKAKDDLESEYGAVKRDAAQNTQHLQGQIERLEKQLTEMGKRPVKTDRREKFVVEINNRIDELRNQINSINQELEEETATSLHDCVICQQKLFWHNNASVTKLPCGHLFHTHCIRVWAERWIYSPVYEEAARRRRWTPEGVFPTCPLCVKWFTHKQINTPWTKKLGYGYNFNDLTWIIVNGKRMPVPVGTHLQNNIKLRF